MNAVQKIHNETIKSDIPPFGIGDSLKVDVLIIEGGKERIQSFTGTVIARNGEGVSESVTLRRVAFGQGVERVLPLNSPRVKALEVIRRGKVRRSKLYYLRDQQGKAARIKELR
ncbi:MAG: 50S ribosomal protein L19 [Lentisphaeria bacterium]|nr:50S ribosomal protein L19 [Lentisphaeria bacterium]